MKKNGFTLIELMAVMVIMGLLILMIAPNLIKDYNESLIEAIVTQEENAVSAAKIFVEDYCLNPITDEYFQKCPNRYKNAVNDKKYLCLSDIQNPPAVNASMAPKPYIDNISFKDEDCKGYILFNKTSTGIYSDAKAYLVCGSEYETEGIDKITYGECLN